MPGRAKKERGKRSPNSVHTIALGEKGMMYRWGPGRPNREERRTVNPSLAGRLGSPTPEVRVYRPVPDESAKGGYKFKLRKRATTRSGDDILIHEGKITGKAKHLYVTEPGFE